MRLFEAFISETDAINSLFLLKTTIEMIVLPNMIIYYQLPTKQNIKPVVCTLSF
jgi:hypothetical protein